jgi:hypothetical protein
MDWQDISTAPKDGSEILIWLGETIPDHMDVRAASYLPPKESEELGYGEYAKYGSWMIWNSGCDWFCVDVTDPLAWTPLIPPQQDTDR